NSFWKRLFSIDTEFFTSSLVIIYTMLKQGTLFDESCFEARRKSCEQKQLSRYIHELEKRGYHVEAQA
ncbi:MAG: hypothetical protein OSJ73_24025, partial [Lachnospiraceae bacterium]|nr:hypothetical protein [Lachnospiraceae bacterium]